MCECNALAHLNVKVLSGNVCHEEHQVSNKIESHGYDH